MLIGVATFDTGAGVAATDALGVTAPDAGGFGVAAGVISLVTTAGVCNREADGGVGGLEAAGGAGSGATARGVATPEARAGVRALDTGGLGGFDATGGVATFGGVM